MAFAFPVVIVMIWMIFQLAQVYRAVAGIQQALGEGARYATLCLNQSFDGLHGSRRERIPTAADSRRRSTTASTGSGLGHSPSPTRPAYLGTGNYYDMTVNYYSADEPVACSRTDDQRQPRQARLGRRRHLIAASRSRFSKKALIASLTSADCKPLGEHVAFHLHPLEDFFPRAACAAAAASAAAPRPAWRAAPRRSRRAWLRARLVRRDG